LNDNHLVAAALTYAKAGWPVFPLVERTKQPIAGCRGQLDATTDEQQIRQWFENNPRLNLAIATGNGLLVLDIDGASGEESLRALEHEIGKLPDTRGVLTGSGSQHLYFAVPVDFESVANLADGVEVKGNGDAITAPPSVHPATGRAYLWDGMAGFQAALADLPLAWLERCRGKARPKKTAGETATQPAGTFPPADATRAAKGCAWLQHCFTDAQGLREPEWYAMLTVIARCENGKHLAHAWSAPYVRYRPAETDYKIRHALEDTGPATCRHVAGELGQFHAYCRKCEHWQQIESPIVLGMDPAARPVPDEPWRLDLLSNGHGRPYPNLHNTAIALTAHPDWQGARLAFDEFRDKVMIRPGAPDAVPAGELDELRFYAITRWLQARLSPTLQESTVRSAIDYVARQHPAHALREWLTGLTWDKVPRIRGRFFQRYFGARATDGHRYKDDADFYLEGVAVSWLVGAVARLFEPGALVEHFVVLEGPHHNFKVKALEVLAGAPYFSGQLPPRLDWQAAVEQIRGVWFVEVSDLAQALQYPATRQFLLRRADQLPAKRGSAAGKISLDRQCIFTGTTAERRYLLDAATIGYALPVLTSTIDWQALGRDRAQLLAEAVHLYREKTPWWPQRELLPIYQVEQEARLVDDPWAERVRGFAFEHPKFSVGQLLEKYEVPFHQQTQPMQQRIERLLLRCGFVHTVQETGDVLWRNPDAVDAAAGATVQ
jgi:predicted P-loop ATPase